MSRHLGHTPGQLGLNHSNKALRHQHRVLPPIWFISYRHHSLTYLSREHMNPQLTCCQRQWLHSSVGRASQWHRYREVTGSSPVEVLNFFQASLRNCKNCDHNCEDHSSFDFISAVHIWFISYASFTVLKAFDRSKNTAPHNLPLSLFNKISSAKTRNSGNCRMFRPKPKPKLLFVE